MAPIGVPVGDLDLDCRVGIHDLLMLLDEWGLCSLTGGCRGDVNDDGEVDFVDLLIVVGNWG